MSKSDTSLMLTHDHFRGPVNHVRVSVVVLRKMFTEITKAILPNYNRFHYRLCFHNIGISCVVILHHSHTREDPE